MIPAPRPRPVLTGPEPALVRPYVVAMERLRTEGVVDVQTEAAALLLARAGRPMPWEEVAR